jgi:hypothetical protein
LLLTHLFTFNCVFRYARGSFAAGWSADRSIAGVPERGRTQAD